MSNSKEILEQNFLEIRSKILELAASLDRIDRAGPIADHPLWNQIQQGINLLEVSSPNRAEQVQLLFSRPYEADWRRKLEV